MDMTVIDIGTFLAIGGLLYKITQDKIQAAEEMGKMKQQIKSLETRAGQIDSKLEVIDAKLGNIMAAIARLEVLIGNREQ
jgi:hypothetical protein